MPPASPPPAPPPGPAPPRPGPNDAPAPPRLGPNDAPAPPRPGPNAPPRPALRRLGAAALATAALGVAHEATARALAGPDALPRLLSFDGSAGSWLALGVALALFGARLSLYLAAPPALAALGTLALFEALGPRPAERSSDRR
ncbi:MAG TPA: hypothetical protein VFS43_00380 [Polyangiaceae bacterium]|nr:hypothetical protein [Polyangiaceae bacterium]